MTRGDLGRRALPPAARDRRRAARRRRRRAGRRARAAGRRVDGVRRHRPRDVAPGGRARGRRTPTCTRPSACIRTTRRSSTTSGTGSTRWPARRRVRRDRRGRVRPPLRALAARRAGGRRSGARSGSRTSSTAPLVIHSRDAWDDTFRVLDDEGVPARTIFHCFTGGPDEARRALDRGVLPVVQRHRVVQERRRRARRGRARAARPRCWWRPTPVPRARAAPRQAQPARVGGRGGRRPRAPRWAAGRGGRGGDRRNAAAVFGLPSPRPPDLRRSRRGRSPS